MTLYKLAPFIFFFLAPLSFSAEVDHYLNSPYELRDATDEVNEAFDHLFIHFLKKINKSRKAKHLSCHQVVIKIGKGFFQGHESKLARLMRGHPTIDRFPKKMIHENKQQKKMSKELFKKSIYGKRKFWPYNTIHLAPVININGLYIGSDKLGHITGMGLAYYQRYNFWRKRGKGHHFALSRAFKFGVLSEKTILGQMASQIFSYADLEANYQGFLLYQSMCDKVRPRLILGKNGKWLSVRKVNLASYVTPYMNEIFNPSTYNKRNGQKILKSLRELHCDLEKKRPLHSGLMKRLQFYKTKSKINESLLWINNQIKKGRLKNNALNSLTHICSNHTYLPSNQSVAPSESSTKSNIRNQHPIF
jgi:hypothetical protein